MVLFAVLAALASAACFAAGSALQHRVANASSASEESKSGFAARLVRRPSWLIGLGLSAVAFCLHALALSQGDLALVQPVIVSGIVFAVLIRAGLDHRWPPRRTMIWLMLTWAGLGLFLLVRPTAVTRSVHHSLAAVFVTIGVIVVIVAMLAARRSQQDRLTGVLLGGASGLLFGLVAGLLKLVLAQASQGLGQTITHWTLWALLAIGGWAVVLNQRAYQATRMSLTTPVLNISQVIVAIVFGILVLGEPAGSSLGVVIGEVVGLAAMILGIRKLAAVPEADQNTDADTSSDDVPAVADRD